MKRILIGCLIAFGVGVGLQGQGQPAPAPPAAPAAPAAPRGGQRGTPVDDGPVRDANDAVIGFTKLAEIPGTPWVIHDAARPHPPIITPGATTGAPPSDAIVLFDGKDLSKWQQTRAGQTTDATWPVRTGYFETGAGSGSIVTKEKFGDIQLHVEFATPTPGRGFSQNRGNSGVILMGRYEIQVLDSFENITYADGQAASIYGQDPPLVNAAKKPGEWQTYDIIFEAPVFSGTPPMAIKPAYFTVFWNGVLVHNRRAVAGPTSPTRTVHAYVPHEAELPLTLQDHAHPVHYRNVWVRRLKGYDGK